MAPDPRSELLSPPFPSRFPRPRARRALERVERALDVLLPALCLHCGDRAGGRWWPHLCPACAASLNAAPAGGARSTAGLRVYAPLAHEGPARTLLHALKYRGATRVGRRLGREIAAAAGGVLTESPPGTLLVPIPLHWTRRWRRGHDQTRALAAGLRGAAPWILAPRALRRVRRTRSQVGLGPEERRRNVDRVFAVRRPDRLRDRPVLLVDDVVTTGATIAAAAEPMRDAGARVLAVLAAARAGRSERGSVDAPNRDHRAA